MPGVIRISVKGIAVQLHLAVSYNGKDRLLFGFYRVDGKGIQHALDHRLFSHPYAHGKTHIALAAYSGECSPLVDRKAFDYLHCRTDVAGDVSAVNVHLSLGNDQMVKVAVTVNIQYRVFVYDKVGYCILAHGSVVERPAVASVDIVGPVNVIIEMILDDINSHYVRNRSYVNSRIVKNNVGVVTVLDDENKVSVPCLPGSGSRAFIMIEAYTGIGNIAQDGVKLTAYRYEGMLAAVRAILCSVGPVSVRVDLSIGLSAKHTELGRYASGINILMLRAVEGNFAVVVNKMLFGIKTFETIQSVGRIDHSYGKICVFLLSDRYLVADVQLLYVNGRVQSEINTAVIIIRKHRRAGQAHAIGLSHSDALTVFNERSAVDIDLRSSVPLILMLKDSVITAVRYSAAIDINRRILTCFYAEGAISYGCAVHIEGFMIILSFKANAAVAAFM